MRSRHILLRAFMLLSLRTGLADQGLASTATYLSERRKGANSHLRAKVAKALRGERKKGRRTLSARGPSLCLCARAQTRWPDGPRPARNGRAVSRLKVAACPLSWSPWPKTTTLQLALPD